MNNIVLFRNTDLAPDAPATFEDMVAKGKELKAAGKVSEIVAYPVGASGDPYHINPLYTSGGGYIFGTEANGDFNPKDLGVGKPESVQAYEKIGALGEKGEGVLKRSITGRQHPEPVHRQEDRVHGLRAVAVRPAARRRPASSTTSRRCPASRAGSRPARSSRLTRRTSPARARTRPLRQEFVTNYWSRPDVSAALFEANPRRAGAPRRRSRRSRPPIRWWSRSPRPAARPAQIMPSIPAMAAVWDPLGKAEAAVVGGADPAATITAAGKAIEAQVK